MFHDIEQNTDEWLLLRSGKLTGSAVSKVMANYGKALGEPAKKLAVDIAIEQITGRPIESGYSNEHMERGHEQEPLARALYQDEYFCEVLNGGFFDNGSTGCSPDGRVDDGLIEIKSVIPSVQYKTIKRNAHDPAYHWQLVFNLAECEKEWIDYISFSAAFPEGQQLFVERLTKEQVAEDIEKLYTRIDEFIELIHAVKSDIKEAA